MAVLVATLSWLGCEKFSTKSTPNTPSPAPSGEDTNLPLVAITQIATHPALDEVRMGLVDGLAKRGWRDGETVQILFRNANGDASLTSSIAADFVKRNPAVIVPISTPSSLAVVREAGGRVPVVFSGVTDPKGVGIVESMENPGHNVTGVSDQWPFRAQVEAFMKYFPDTKKIGMLFTRGDDVSKIGVEAMTELSKSMEFELALSPVSAAPDIYPSAIKLAKNVNALYTGIDHLILENMDGLVRAANETKTPIFGGESGSVEKGAVLALSINMTQFGDLTAEVASKVLKGTAAGNIPVQVVTTGDLIANKKSATDFGLTQDRLENDGFKFIAE